MHGLANLDRTFRARTRDRVSQVMRLGSDAAEVCQLPTVPGLTDEEVHVWETTLDLAPELANELAKTLSADERERAGRLRFERDRRRFIVCRGLLRGVLAQYLRTVPRSIEFCYGRHGKPAIATPTGGHSLRFNVAHAHDVGVFGIAKGHEIGIDVERIRADVNFDQIAGRFFSSRELAAFRGLSRFHRRIAFFRCWTRKEAYVKARGDGLWLPLSEFDVSVAPDGPARLLSLHDDPSEALCWRLEDLRVVAPGYVAAIAVEGHDVSLRYCRWPRSDD